MLPLDLSNVHSNTVITNHSLYGNKNDKSRIWNEGTKENVQCLKNKIEKMQLDIDALSEILDDPLVVLDSLETNMDNLEKDGRRGMM